MPMDCLPASTVYCIPAAYEAAYVYSGTIVRVSPDRTPFVVTEAAFRQAGARFVLWSWDAVMARPVEGFRARAVGSTIIYYRAGCDSQLACSFEIGQVAPAPIAAQPPVRARGVVTYQLDIAGVDRAGLAKALRAASFMVRTQDGEVTLVPLSALLAQAE